MLVYSPHFLVFHQPGPCQFQARVLAKLLLISTAGTDARAGEKPLQHVQNALIKHTIEPMFSLRSV